MITIKRMTKKEKESLTVGLQNFYSVTLLRLYPLVGQNIHKSWIKNITYLNTIDTISMYQKIVNFYCNEKKILITNLFNENLIKIFKKYNMLNYVK